MRTWIVRRKLFDRIKRTQGMRCHWCKCQIKRIPLGYRGALDDDHATLEHLTPIMEGGAKYNRRNIVLACNRCNNARGGATGRKSAERLAAIRSTKGGGDG